MFLLNNPQRRGLIIALSDIKLIIPADMLDNFTCIFKLLPFIRVGVTSEFNTDAQSSK